MPDAPNPTALGRIGQIALTVRDLSVSVPFYRDALGIPFLFQVPNLAFFDCAGVRLMLGLPESGDFQPSTGILYFDVPDIQATYRALSARGVTFRSGPERIARLPDREVWMAFLADPDGNILALMSELKLS